MRTWSALRPHPRRDVNANFYKLSRDTTMIISDAEALWNVLANPVGSDVIAERQSYPLNFRQQ
jgi:hypothetical protein